MDECREFHFWNRSASLESNYYLFVVQPDVKTWVGTAVIGLGFHFRPFMIAG